jgi:hypothetical protein
MDVYEVMYVKGEGGGEVNRLNTLKSITRRRGRGGRKERKAVEEYTKGEEGFFFFLPWVFFKKIYKSIY